MGSTVGAGTAYPSRAIEFTHGFRVVRVSQSLVFCVVLWITVCPFSFGHCIVCPPSIYDF